MNNLNALMPPVPSTAAFCVKSLHRKKTKFAIKQKLLVVCLMTLFAFTTKAQTGNSCANAIHFPVSNTSTTCLNNQHTTNKYTYYHFRATEPVMYFAMTSNTSYSHRIKYAKVYGGTCSNLVQQTAYLSSSGDSLLNVFTDFLIAGDNYYLVLESDTVTCSSCINTGTHFSVCRTVNPPSVLGNVATCTNDTTTENCQLVNNGGFEDYLSCPTNFNQLSNNVCSMSSPSGGTPDYYNGCEGTSLGYYWFSTPDNINACNTPSMIGSNNALGGNAYAGAMLWSSVGTNYEYIQTALKRPMLAGEVFTVSFYVALSNSSIYAISNFGVLFTQNLINQSPSIQNLASISPAYTPQLVYSGSPVTSFSWTQISFTYTVPAGQCYNYMTIGNFAGASTNTVTLPPQYPTLNVGSFDPCGGAHGWANGFYVTGNTYYFFDGFSVIKTAIPPFTVPPVASCGGGTFSLSVTNPVQNCNTSQNAYGYTWPNSTTNHTSTDAYTTNITVSPITVTETSPACSVTQTATTSITISHTPPPTPILSGTLCAGTINTLAITNYSSSNSYSWSPSGDVTCGNCPTVTITNPTYPSTYTVVATNTLTNCTSTATIAVNTPPLHPIISGTLCTGVTNTLSITNYNSSDIYNWTPSTGVSCGSCPIVTITNPVSPHYIVTATDPSTGCVSSGVIVGVALSPTLTVTPTFTTICSGNSVVLNAATSFPFAVNVTWSPASSLSCSGPIPACLHPIATPTATTNYTVTATNHNTGCTASTIATVSVNPTPFVSINSNPNPAIYCNTVAGSSVALSPTTSGTTFTWSPSNGLSCTSCASPIATPTTTTTYTLSTTLDGCTATSDITVYVECQCTNGAVLTATNITTPVFFLGTVHSINNNSTIAASMTLSDKVLYFGAGVSLTVPSGVNLTLHHCHLLACSDMWQGIIVQPGGTLTVDNNSMIEDAYVAIDCPNWTSATTNSLTVNGCVFNRNQIGIEFSEASILSYGSAFNIPASVHNSVFTCRTIASHLLPFIGTPTNWTAPTPAALKTTVVTFNQLQTPYELANNTAYATTTLKPPMTTQVSNWGIYLSNVGSSLLNGTTSAASFLATPNTYYDMTIGDNSTTTSLNLFDNHWIGIYAANSNFTSINNAFELMYDPGCKKCLTSTGIAIYGVNSNLGSYDFTRANITYPGYSPTVVPSSVPVANSNIFYDCAYSALIQNYQEVNIAGNQVRSRQGSGVSIPVNAGAYGFYVTTPVYQNVNMLSNQITNIKNGITFAAGVFGGTTQARGFAHADNNTITANFGSAPGYRFVSNAIQMDNAVNCYPGGSAYPCITAPTSSVTANNNTLQQVYRGIEMSNWSSSKQGTGSCYANNNIVTLVTDPSSPTATQFGINVNNTYFHQIIDNNINGSGTGNLNMRGIYCVDNSQSTVHCNYTSTLGKGLEFVGPSPAIWATYNTASVATNTMTVNQYGFALTNNCVLGAQGNISAASDNLWTGSWTGTNYATYVDALSNAASSQLYVRSPSAPYFPPTCSFGGLLSQSYCSGSGNIISTAAPSTATCSALPQPPCTTCPLGGRTIAERITQDSLNFPALANENGFRAKLDIFRMMLADSAISDSSLILKNFFLANQSTSLNTITGIESNIAQGNTSAAQSMNAAFAPATVIESNHKALFTSMINYAGNTYTPSDSLTLITLAQSCPAIAGDAVYQARVVYNAVYSQYQYFADNCNYDSLAANHASRLANKTAGIASTVNKQSLYLMYPNPTTGTVYISGGNITDTQLYVEVQDLTGRTISKQILTVTNGLAVLQNTLVNGVYMISIKGADGKVTTQRLIVNN